MSVFRRGHFHPGGLHLRLIRLAGVLVPRRLRPEWRQEWEAELRHREALLATWNRLDRTARLHLLRRSAGACWDALWLQPKRLEDDMVQDLRYGARTLLRNPLFTLTAVLTLALGIGANITIFSVVDAAIIRSLPFEAADRLVGMWHVLPGNNRFFTGIRREALEEWRKQAGLFDQIEACTGKTLLLTGAPEAEYVSVPAVTPGTFRMLGVQPQLGRSFLAEEGAPGRGQVAILSDALWRQRFGANPHVLGAALRLGARSYTIVGVMPPRFKYPIWGEKEPQLWIPLALSASDANGTVIALARLRRGVSMKTAENALNALASQLERVRPDAEGIGWRVMLFSPDEMYFKKYWRPRLLALFAAGGFVLLLACVNAANLLLSRAAGRQRELAIRTAVGASRLRLIRQLLTESVLLALLGAASGLVVAWWSIHFLNILAPDTIRSMSFQAIAVDGRVVTFAAGLAALTSLIFGLLPALKGSRTDVEQSLVVGRSGGPSHVRLRSALAVAEIAISLVLLVGAGLTTRSFVRLSQQPLGFDPHNLLNVVLTLPSQRYPTAPVQQAFFDELTRRLALLPGAHGVTTSAAMSANAVEFQIEGRPPQPPTPTFMPDLMYVEPNYFAVMRAGPTRGRAFTREDRDPSMGVALVSDRLARRYWPDGNAVGRRFRLEGTGSWHTIVGIAPDTPGTGAANMMAIYYPLAAQPQPPGGLRTRVVHMRVASAPEAAIPLVKTQVRAIDKDLPIWQIGTFENLALQRPRFYSVLMSAFAAIALVLAGIGVYGVLAFLASQRTHEIGVRLALGATGRDVLRLIVGRGLVLTLCGTAIGIAASLALTRFLASLLIGISATDRLSFALAAGVLVATAVMASYIPAMRARHVDPVNALRHE